jgi:hypothetical protein
MDVEKVLKLNNLIGEYKEFNLSEDPSQTLKAEEQPDISETDKVIRKIHFRTVYNEEEIVNLKKIIDSLRQEIKELKDKQRFSKPEPRIQKVIEKIPEKKQEKEEKQQIIKEAVTQKELESEHVAIEDYFYCGVR